MSNAEPSHGEKVRALLDWAKLNEPLLVEAIALKLAESIGGSVGGRDVGLDSGSTVAPMTMIQTSLPSSSRPLRPELPPFSGMKKIQTKHLSPPVLKKPKTVPVSHAKPSNAQEPSSTKSLSGTKSISASSKTTILDQKSELQGAAVAVASSESAIELRIDVPQGLSPAGKEFYAVGGRAFIDKITSGRRVFHPVIHRTAVEVGVDKEHVRLLQCLFLIDALGVADEFGTKKAGDEKVLLKKRLVRMTELARDARARVDAGKQSRGIPMTPPDSYSVFRRGGPETSQRRYVVDGKKMTVLPPGIGLIVPEIADMMQAFEMELFGISDLGMPVSTRLEGFIRDHPVLKKRFPYWVERSLSAKNAHEMGIPSLSAPFARELLKSTLPAHGTAWSSLLTESPRSFYEDKSGKPTDLARDFFLDIFMGDLLPKSARARRLLKFAVARLLWVPLDRVEREIFEIAFQGR